MSGFELRFGPKIKVSEIEALTGLSRSTILRHYQQFGGIKIGHKYLFYENKLIEALEANHAYQKDNQRETSLAGPRDSSRREEERENIPDKKGGRCVGSDGPKGDAGHITSRHGLW